MVWEEVWVLVGVLQVQGQPSVISIAGLGLLGPGPCVAGQSLEGSPGWVPLLVCVELYLGALCCCRRDPFEGHQRCSHELRVCNFLQTPDSSPALVCSLLRGHVDC